MRLAAAPDGTLNRRGSGRTALTVDRLTLVRDQRRILDHIGFTLFAGEIAGIAGVDGNGQTELVEVMAGIRAPTSGSVRVLDASDIRRHGAMAVIPQNRDLDGLIRGKASGISRLGDRLASGIGLTVAMQAFSLLERLTPVEGMGPVGEIRLMPDPDTFVVLPYLPHLAAMIADMVVDTEASRMLDWPALSWPVPAA